MGCSSSQLSVPGIKPAMNAPRSSKPFERFGLYFVLRASGVQSTERSHRPGARARAKRAGNALRYGDQPSSPPQHWRPLSRQSNSKSGNTLPVPRATFTPVAPSVRKETHLLVDQVTPSVTVATPVLPEPVEVLVVIPLGPGRCNCTRQGPMPKAPP